jgi:hypothetical protein
MIQSPILVAGLIWASLILGENAPKGIFYKGNSES